MTVTTSRRQLALVTHAASPLGFALAHEFAANGFDLIVVADTPEITTIAARLRVDGAQVDPVRTGLATADEVNELARHCRNAERSLDAIAITIGPGLDGPFVGGTDLDRELNGIDLDIRSTVHLAKRLIPDLVERGAGRVLLSAAHAAAAPGSTAAVARASAAFIEAFAAALREELSEDGVSVTSLVLALPHADVAEPIGFDSDAQSETGIETGGDPAGQTQSDGRDAVAAAAHAGFVALIDGDERASVDSLRSRAQDLAARVLPEGLKARLHGARAETGTPPADQ
jgi:short-subunit dehydrogenase